ncbi:MAG: hypothetical protein J6J30_02395 [Clostridia bacterium]|nr:hypothetical protein [Oscillospiraceae bacterium]MBP3599909.1 hypothetical protein [Clostridia bacterium]
MKKVTCWYCEHYEVLYQMDFINYVDAGFGKCYLKNRCVKKERQICERFELRRGLHTLKWYPGKTGEW